MAQAQDIAAQLTEQQAHALMDALMARLGVGTTTTREEQDEGVRFAHAAKQAVVVPGTCDTCGKTGLIANTRCKRCRAGKAPRVAKQAAPVRQAPAPRVHALHGVGKLGSDQRMGAHKACDPRTCGFCVNARKAHNAAVDRRNA